MPFTLELHPHGPSRAPAPLASMHTLLAAALAVLACLLLPASATAIAPPAFVTEWGSLGSGEGQFNLPTFIALAPNGSVYVTDTDNYRVEEFDPDGHFVTAWGTRGEGPGQFTYPAGIAIGPSGDVYVGDIDTSRIERFSHNGAFISEWGEYGEGPGQFEGVLGLAAGPSGDIYAADKGDNRVEKFSANGVYLGEWGQKGEAAGDLSSPVSVATDAQENVYVTSYATFGIQKFTSTGHYLSRWDPAKGGITFANGLAVSASGQSYVDTPNDVIEEFGTTGTPLTEWGEYGAHQGQFANSLGLAVDPAADVYVVDQGNNRVEKFRFDTTPSVLTGTGVASSTTTAMISATVNPNGVEVTSCEFEYGTSTSYGSRIPCATAPGSGESPLPVSAEITSLAPNTTYHFRVVASNSAGSGEGLDARLTTLGPPDFGRCVAVVAEKIGAKTVYHGEFTTPKCTVTSVKKAGKYEWEAGVVNSAFILKAGALALSTPSGRSVTCATESGGGDYLGSKEVADVTLRFTKCASQGQNCSTVGFVEGDVESSPLEGSLGWISRAAKTVALDLYPAGNKGTILEYRCGAEATVIVSGSVLVGLKTGKMQVSETLKYKASHGVQGIRQLEGEPEDVLIASTAGPAPETTGLSANTIMVDEEEVELNPDA